MFQSEILNCGKVWKTHRLCGLSALSFKHLKSHVYNFLRLFPHFKIPNQRIIIYTHTHAHTEHLRFSHVFQLNGK